MGDNLRKSGVVPAKAGIHWLLKIAKWIPAFAGMTIFGIRASRIFAMLSKSYLARV
jgi:hypothetical protein